MKKFTFLIGILLFSASFAWAQEKSHFSGGFYVGVNGAQIDGDAYYGYYHGGLDIAGTAQYPLSDRFFLSMDLGYSQKGAEDKFSEFTGNLYKININYIDLPILIHYYDRKKWGFYVGLQYSRVVGTPKETIYNNIPYANYSGINISTAATGYSNYQGVTEVNNNDYEYLVGMDYYFADRFSFDMRFCYSIIPMGYSPESLYRGFGTFNNLIQFRLGYIFGQDFDKDRTEKWLKKVKVE